MQLKCNRKSEAFRTASHFTRQSFDASEVKIELYLCSENKVVDKLCSYCSIVIKETCRSFVTLSVTHTCYPEITSPHYENLPMQYEGGSESSVIGVITLLIDMIGCCIIP